MKYVCGHKRKTRGEAIHRTKGERDKAMAEEKKREDKQKEGPAKPLERVATQFLIPKSKNFIETEAVKKYEEKIRLWLKANYPVHIIGPTGCGKTALAIRIAEKIGNPAVWINGDEEITTSDLIGGYAKLHKKSVRDKYIHNVHKSEDIIEPEWVSNPLALACQNGYTLIYNEFSRAKPEANNVLLSVLEEGILELPTKYGSERYIKVHPNFNLLLTSNNIEYAGIHRPQDALLDRIATIYMDYYDKDTEIKIVKAHSKISADRAERIVSIIRGLRAKLKGAEKPGTRPAIMIAQALQGANGVNQEYLEELCTDSIASKTKDLKELAEKRQFVREQIKKIS